MPRIFMDLKPVVEALQIFVHKPLCAGWGMCLCRVSSMVVIVNTIQIEYILYSKPDSDTYQTVTGNTRQHHGIPNNTKEYHATSGNTRQYQAIPHSTRQYQTVPGNTRQHQAIPVNTRQYQTIPSNTRQHQAIPVNTRQY